MRMRRSPPKMGRNVISRCIPKGATDYRLEMLEVVSTVLHYMVHILLTTAAAILLYVAAKGAKKLFMVSRTYYIC